MGPKQIDSLIHKPEVLVLALGSEILGSSGIPLRLMEYLQSRQPGRADYRYAAVGGADLIQIIDGYQSVMVIDTCPPGKGSIEPILLLDPAQWKLTDNLESPHYEPLAQVLELGVTLGFNMPRKVVVLGIPVQEVYEFKEIHGVKEEKLKEMLIFSERCLMTLCN